MDLLKILEGTYNELVKANLSISQERLEICNKCPILDKKYMICDKALWLNPKTKRVSSVFKKGYYRGCGCRLKAKTTLIDEHCPAKLW